MFDKIFETLTPTYIIVFEGNIAVPWRLLTYKETKSLQGALFSNLFTPLEAEDKVFDLCVLDDTIKNIKDILPAGIISTVADVIMYLSAIPTDAGGLNEQLNMGRAEYQSDPFVQLSSLICQVYPYKLEDLKIMSWMDIVRLATAAEFMLLKTGELGEPLVFQSLEETPKKPDKARAKREEAILKQELGIRKRTADEEKLAAEIDSEFMIEKYGPDWTSENFNEELHMRKLQKRIEMARAAGKPIDEAPRKGVKRITKRGSK